MKTSMCARRFIRTVRTTLWTLTLLCLAAPAARAQHIWNSGAKGNWSVGANWTGGTPTAGGGVDTTITLNNGVATNDLAGNFRLNNFTFINSTSGKTNAGNYLVFINSSGAAEPTITQSGNGLGVINNNLWLTNRTTISGTGTGTVRFAGSIGGTGGVIKAGTFQMTISGTNWFSGGTRIDAGVLDGGGANGKFGADAITLNGGEFRRVRGNNGGTTFSNNFVVAASGGRLVFMATGNGPSESYIGSISVGGPFVIMATNSGGGASMTFTGAVSGASSLRLVPSANAGAAPLRILSPMSGFTGTIQIDPQTGGVYMATTGGGAAGSITVKAGAALGLGSMASADLNRLTMEAGSVLGIDTVNSTALDLLTRGWDISLGSVVAGTNTATITPNASTYRFGGGGGTLYLTQANTLTGANQMIMDRRGTLSAMTLVLSAANNYSGPTTIGSGNILDIRSDGALGSGAVTNAANSVLRITATSATITNDIMFSGNAAVTSTVRVATFTGNFDYNTRTITMGASSGGIYLNPRAGKSVSGSGTLNVGTLLQPATAAALGTGGVDLQANGILLLHDGMTWADLMGARTLTSGTPAGNQIRINNAGGGFAARGTDQAITTLGTSTATFNTNFNIGSTARDASGAFYANATLDIQQGIALTARRTVTVAHSGPGWGATGPATVLSGGLSGTGVLYFTTSGGGTSDYEVAEVVIGGTANNWTGTAYGSGDGANFSCGRGGLWYNPDNAGMMIRLASPSALPSGATATAYIAGLGSGYNVSANYRNGIILTGDTDGETYDFNRSSGGYYQLVIGALDMANALDHSKFGVLGSHGGKVLLKDVYLNAHFGGHAYASNSAARPLAVLTREGSELTLGAPGEPVIFRATWATNDAAAMNLTTPVTTLMESTTTNRALTKLGLGTLILGNVDYQKVDGSANYTNFTWRLGRDSGANHGTFHDGAVRSVFNGTLADSLRLMRVNFKGGVLEVDASTEGGEATLNVGLGQTTQLVNMVSWTDFGDGTTDDESGGGWAAYGNPVIVDITNMVSVQWDGTAWFARNQTPLIFGSRTANNRIKFIENIDLNNATRRILTVDNTNSTTDYTELSGNISHASGFLWVHGDGTLVLSGALTFGGTLGATNTAKVYFNGTQNSGTSVMRVYNGATLGGVGTSVRSLYAWDGGTVDAGALPGQVGTLTVSNFHLQASATLNVDINNTTNDIVACVPGDFTNAAGVTMTIKLGNAGRTTGIATGDHFTVVTYARDYYAPAAFAIDASAVTWSTNNIAVHHDATGKRIYITGIQAEGPTVTSVPATNIEQETAWTVGNVTSTGGLITTARLYWGDNDGLSATGDWDTVVNLGVRAEGAVSNELTGLSAGSTYYYRYYVTNSIGYGWSATVSFTTTGAGGAPSVATLAPSAILDTSATFNGQLVSEGATVPDVYVYWGETDGLLVKDDWDTFENLGPSNPSNVSWTATTLTEGTVYYYKFYATNTSGDAWASGASAVFTTKVNVAINVVNASASEAGPTAGSVSIARSTDIGVDLTVNLNIGGTATAGGDYAALPVSVVLTNGQTNLVVTIDPVDDTETEEGTENVLVTLLAGDYVLGTPTNVTVNIAENDVPTGAPTVANAAESGVTYQSANLNGSLTGGNVAHVWVYYGRTDGVENKNAWEASVYVGNIVEGAFSTNITGLVAATGYYYRVYASNSFDDVWAGAAETFSTPWNSLAWDKVSAGTEQWTTAVNWNPDAVPNAGTARAVIDNSLVGANNLPSTIQITTTPVTVGRLEFDSTETVDLDDITGGTLTVERDFVKQGSGRLNIDAPTTIGGDVAIAAGGMDLGDGVTDAFRADSITVDSTSATALNIEMGTVAVTNAITMNAGRVYVGGNTSLSNQWAAGTIATNIALNNDAYLQNDITYFASRININQRMTIAGQPGAGGYNLYAYRTSGSTTAGINYTNLALEAGAVLSVYENNTSVRLSPRLMGNATLTRTALNSSNADLQDLLAEAGPATLSLGRATDQSYTADLYGMIQTNATLDLIYGTLTLLDLATVGIAPGGALVHTNASGTTLYIQNGTDGTNQLQYGTITIGNNVQLNVRTTDVGTGNPPKVNWVGSQINILPGHRARPRPYRYGTSNVRGGVMFSNVVVGAGAFVEPEIDNAYWFANMRLEGDATLSNGVSSASICLANLTDDGNDRTLTLQGSLQTYLVGAMSGTLDMDVAMNGAAVNVQLGQVTNYLGAAYPGFELGGRTVNLLRGLITIGNATDPGPGTINLAVPEATGALYIQRGRDGTATLGSDLTVIATNGATVMAYVDEVAAGNPVVNWVNAEIQARPAGTLCLRAERNNDSSVAGYVVFSNVVVGAGASLLPQSYNGQIAVVNARFDGDGIVSNAASDSNINIGNLTDDGNNRTATIMGNYNTRMIGTLGGTLTVNVNLDTDGDTLSLSSRTNEVGPWATFDLGGRTLNTVRGRVEIYSGLGNGTINHNNTGAYLCVLNGETGTNTLTGATTINLANGVTIEGQVERATGDFRTNNIPAIVAINAGVTATVRAYSDSNSGNENSVWWNAVRLGAGSTLNHSQNNSVTNWLGNVTLYGDATIQNNDSGRLRMVNVTDQGSNFVLTVKGSQATRLAGAADATVQVGGVAGAGTLDVSGGAWARTLHVNTNGSVRMGAPAAVETLVMNAGTLNLGANLTASNVVGFGTIGVSTGLLLVTDSLAPGTDGETGMLTATCSVNLASTTVLEWDIGATTGDLFRVTGSTNVFTLDGTLNVTDAGGFVPGTYTIMTYNATLVNNGLTVGTLPGGMAGTITAGSGKVILEVVAAPTVTTGAGAIPDADGTAILRGALTAGGHAQTYVFWGATDQGAVLDAWANTNSIGDITQGAFSAFATGLTPGDTYHYRTYATNAAGYDWADSTVTFTVPEMVDWGYKMPIIFTGYVGTATLTNFPALVVLNQSIPNFLYSSFAQNQGGDLRFTASDQTTVLKHEVEKWNASGDSYIWVRVPAISGTNTTIYAFWNNASVTNFPVSQTNGATFSERYRAVFHLNEAGGSSAAYDSSTNRAVSTTAAGVTFNAAGYIGPSASFDGTSGYIELADSAALDGNMTQLTIEGWAYDTAPDASASRGFVAKRTGNAVDESYYTFAHAGGAWNMNFEITNTRLTTNIVAASTWTWLTFTFDGSLGANNMKIYRNTALMHQGNDAASAVPNAASTLRLGGMGGSGIWIGKMDEIRISDVVRGDDWRWATWANMVSNAMFNGYGEAQQANEAMPVINNATESAVTFNSATFNGSLVSTGESATAVYVFWGLTNGNTVLGDWANTNYFGPDLPQGALATNITGLTPGATYYYRYYATNAGGPAWAASSEPVTLLGAPIVTNRTFTWTSQSAATLNGFLVSTGVAPTTVILYWGTVDGGITNTAWGNTNNLGEVGEGAKSQNLSGLSVDTVYYYRWYATNQWGFGWAPETRNFARYSAYNWDGGGANDDWTTALNWNNDYAPQFDGTEAITVSSFGNGGRTNFLAGDKDVYRLSLGDGADAVITTLMSPGETLTLRRSGESSNDGVYRGGSNDGDPMYLYPNVVFNAGVGAGSFTAVMRELNNSSGGNRFYGNVSQAAGESWTLDMYQNSARGQFQFYGTANAVSAFKTHTTVGFHDIGAVGSAELIFAAGNFQFNTADFYTTPLNVNMSFEGNGNIEAVVPMRFVGNITQGSYSLGFLGGTVIRFEPASYTGTGSSDIREGTFSVSSMSALSSGFFSVGNNGGASPGEGVFVLGSGDVPSWADFTSARSWNQSGGSGTWRLSPSGRGGFAARNANVTLTSGVGGVTSSTFARYWILGSSESLSGSRYATNKVTIAADIALAGGTTYKWRAIGNGLSDGVGTYEGFWRLGNMMHEISGNISGGAGTAAITIHGTYGNTGANAGGILRFSGDNSGASLARLTIGDGSGSGSGENGWSYGGAVAIFAGWNAIPPTTNLYVNGGGDSSRMRNLMLFEDVNGAGNTTFKTNFTVQTAGENASGFGAWGGDVVYEGNVLLKGPEAFVTFNRMALYVHQAATLTVQNATITHSTSTSNWTYRLAKSGLGELTVTDTFSFKDKVADTVSTNWTTAENVTHINLLEGTLHTIGDGGNFRGKLVDMPATNTVTRPDWDNLFNISSATFPGLTRTWRVSTADQVYELTDGRFENNTGIRVESGITLITKSVATTDNLAGESGGDILSKTGAGTWVYSNALVGASTDGSAGSLVRVDEGVFDLSGDLGQTGVRVSGGTLLLNTSSLIGVTNANERGLEVDADGGIIGIGRYTTGDLTRTNTLTWGQTAGTLTLQAKGNQNLIFSNAAFPDVAAGATLLIARDGAGTGVVQLNDTAITVAGALGGTGSLKLGAAGTGTLTVNGTVMGGTNGVVGTLPVQGHVTLGAASVLSFDFDGPTTNDVLAITGNLTLDGTLNVNDLGNLTTGTYVIITYTGSLTDNTLAIGTIPPAYPTSVIDLSVPGEVRLSVVEPPPMPVIDVAAGATNVTTNSVLTRGYLTSTGGSPTTVWVYYGETDGADDKGAWDANTNIGQKVVGALSQTLPVTYNANYYYRYYASNDAGGAWAPTSSWFSTLPITVSASDATATEGGDTAAFTVLRDATATNMAVVVSYTVGGTATVGSDYTALTGTVEIPAGATSAVITVTALNDLLAMEAPETVSITLTTCTLQPVGISYIASVTILQASEDYLPDYQYRTKIHFPGYNRAETLTNFPLLVQIGTNIAGFSYSQVQTGGTDIRFFSGDNQQELPYELEVWAPDDASNSYAWVSVPRVNSATNIWMQWGNAALTTAPAYLTNGAVWSGYLAVWHLTASNGFEYLESTTNAYHGRRTTGGATAPGIVGRSYSPLNSGDILATNTFAYTGADNAAKTYTFTLWSKSASTTTDDRFMQSISGNIILEYHYPGIQYYDGTGWRGAYGSGIDDNNWKHIGFVLDGGAGTGLMSMDGLPVASGLTYTPRNLGGNTRLGSNDAGTGNELDGYLDEFRIYLGARSTNWLWAEYMNAASNSLFNSYGPREIVGAPAITNTAVSNLTATAGVLYGNLVSTGYYPTAAWIYWGKTDGGDDRAAWRWTNSFGARAPGVLSTNLNLLAGTNWYFRYFASNSAAMAWASPTFFFQQATIEMVASDNAASEDGPATGAFHFYRGATVTNDALTINYAVYGTASNGVDYTALTGTVIMAAGVTNATVAVTPVDDAIWSESNETVTVVLLPGTYIMGALTNATVTIEDNDLWDDWSLNMKLVFEGYGKSQTLTNFAALIKLDESLTGFDYDNFASASGYDLRFATSDGQTELPYEIETWNPAGTSYVWVKVPAIAGTNTMIYAYWGNPAATAAQGYLTDGSVWSGQYTAVWHLDETSAAYVDATANGHNGTAAGGVTRGVAAKASAGAEFDGTDGNVQAADAVQATAAATFMGWIKADTVGSSAIILSQDNVDNQNRGYSFGLNASGDLLVKIGNNSLTRTITGTGAGITAGTWAHAAFVWNGSAYTFYVNGAQVFSGTQAITGYVNVVRNTYLGAGCSGSAYPPNAFLDGTLDEVRILAGTLSSNWVWAVWKNMASNAQFVTYGTAASGVPLIQTLAATNVQAGSAVANATLDSFGDDTSANVWLYWGNEDGGADRGGWDTTVALGPVATLGALATNLTLGGADNYYYRFYASNGVGGAWSASGVWFMNGAVSVAATDSAATEAGPTTGAFTISRPAGLTNGALHVTYTMSGAAVNGTDYTTLTGGVTLAAGAVSTVITVTPVDDVVWNEGNESVILTVTASQGYYRIGTASDTVTIADNDNWSDWSFQVPIVFTGYVAQGTLTNFPVLVKVGTNIAYFSYTQMGFPATGADLRFSSSDGATDLPYEIEQWNNPGTSYVWVRVPTISGTNSSITMRWGNAGVSAPNNGSNVWSQFRAVWHLNEQVTDENTSASHLDSGTNLLHATQSRNDDLTAVVGRGQVLDGALDFIEVTDGANAALDVTAGLMTWSGWVRFDGAASGSYDALVFRKDTASDNDGWAVRKNNNNTGLQVFGSGATSYDAANVVTGWVGNTWWHLTVVYNGASASVYRDGVLIGSGVVGTIANNNDPLTFGENGSRSATEWTGAFDEFRFSRYVQDSNWVWATWATMATNLNFAKYGLLSGDIPIVETLNAATNIIGATADVVGNVISTGGAPTTIYVYYGDNDGGQGPWDMVKNGGIKPEGVATVNVDSLAVDTTYYYRFLASNDNGTTWADQTYTFLSAGKPIVSAASASAVTAGGATFNGYLSSTGTAATTVYAFWGTVDQTTSKDLWQKSTNFGVRPMGALALPILDSLDSTIRYFRFYASNTVGEAWSESVSFALLSGFEWDGGGADDNWTTALNWNNNVAPGDDGSSEVKATNFTASGRAINLNGNRDILKFELGDGAAQTPVARLDGGNNTLTLRKNEGGTNGAYRGRSRAAGNAVEIRANVSLNAGAAGTYTSDWVEVSSTGAGGQDLYGKVTETAGQDWTLQFRKTGTDGYLNLYNPTNDVAGLRALSGTIVEKVNGALGASLLTLAGGGFTFEPDHVTNALANNITLAAAGTLNGRLRLTGTLAQGANMLTVGNGAPTAAGELVRLETTDMTGGDTGNTVVGTNVTFAAATMAKLATGYLNLQGRGGAFVLGDGTVAPTWAQFIAARTWDQAGAANTWRLNGGGFAAKGAAVTIPADANTDSSTFARDFTLGGGAITSGVLYADQSVTIAQTIALVGSQVTKWTVNSGPVVDSQTGWTLAGPVHQLSGQITGGDASAILALSGSGSTPDGNLRGGLLRISNAANSFQAATLYIGTKNSLGAGFGADDDRGGLVAIFTSDGAFGNAATNIVVSAGTGARASALLLFEDADLNGETFTTDFTVQGATNRQSGFGSYGGTVTYTGTATLDGSFTATAMPVHVESGVLTLGTAAAAMGIQNDRGGKVRMYKGGLGELVLSNIAYGGDNTTWRLYDGTLTTTTGGVLRASDPVIWDELLNTSTNARTWKVTSVSQRYDNMGNGGYLGAVELFVAADIELTTAMLGQTNLYAASASSVLRKTGDGIWSYAGNRTVYTDGSVGQIRVEEGTLDVRGAMGAAALYVDGATVLAGNISPVVGAPLYITSAGGKIGVSTGITAGVSVVRPSGTALNGWDQSAVSTVTLAARDDSSLAFDNTTFPDVTANTTLRITRDGTGAGVVRLGDTAVTVGGTLQGDGTLQMGAAANGTLTVNGTVTPGTVTQHRVTLTVTGNVAVTTGAVLNFDLGGVEETNDKLAVFGNLTGSGTITINVTDIGGGFRPGVYTLAEYSGTLTGASAWRSATVVTPQPTWRAWVRTSTSGKLELVVRTRGSLFRIR